MLVFIQIYGPLGSGFGPTMTLLTVPSGGTITPSVVNTSDLLAGMYVDIPPGITGIIAVSNTSDCSIEIDLPTQPTTTTSTTISSDCICSPGFTPLPDDSGCQSIDTAVPTQTANLTPGDGTFNSNYGKFGVKIYQINGYDLQGVETLPLAFYGPSVQVDGIPSTPTEIFWSNRMNSTSLWVTGNATWPWPGSNYPGTLSLCDTITLTQSATYYIGIAGDNIASIRINGVNIVTQPPGEIALNFNFWHIYPVNLNAGTNLIELQGTNTSEVGAFSAEIYNNTLFELSTATSVADLNLVFSTGNYRTGGPSAGQSFCSNFQCPHDFVYNTLTGNCERIQTLPCGATTSTTTSSTSTTSTSTSSSTTTSTTIAPLTTTTTTCTTSAPPANTIFTYFDTF